MQDKKIYTRNIRWNEAERYSTSQKIRMQLGGAVGTFEMSGRFTNYEMMILDCASKFSIGKNTTFGLGNIEIWKK